MLLSDAQKVGPLHRSPFARKPRPVERAIERLIQLVALVSIAGVLLILVFIGKEGLPVLFDGATSMFGTTDWQPVSEPPRYGAVTLFAGTLKVTATAVIVAVPISVGAAVYVAELARPRVREFAKPVIELLAGVPSVVIGFFALVVMATWVQRVFSTEHRLNALVAGVGLAFAICPIVFSVSEDALRSVPQAYRAAATALGSTKAQVLLRVVLPAASPGIAAAVVLGFGRAVGETMIVVLASGNAGLLDASLGHSARTITATIAQELGEVVVGSPHYHVLFALGALLFLATFAINSAGVRVVRAMRERMGGGS